MHNVKCNTHVQRRTAAQPHTCELVIDFRILSAHSSVERGVMNTSFVAVEALFRRSGVNRDPSCETR